MTDDLQLQMNKLSLGHAENKKDLEYVRDSIVRIEKKMDKFIECADEKYSPMTAWSVMKWSGAVIGGAILLALLGLILVPNAHAIAQVYINFFT